MQSSIKWKILSYSQDIFWKLEKEKKVTIVDCNNKVKEREGEMIFLCELYALC